MTLRVWLEPSRPVAVRLLETALAASSAVPSVKPTVTSELEVVEAVELWVTATLAGAASTATPWVLAMAWAFTCRSGISPSAALTVLEAVMSPVVRCLRVPVRAPPPRLVASEVLPVAAVVRAVSPA